MQPPATTQNHPQPPITTQKPPKNYPKKPKLATNSYCTETDVNFDSDMKQWYRYMCVSVCVYTL